MPELYDPLVPENLKETQEWFGSVITMPLINLENVRERSRRGELVEDEAKRFIVSQGALTAHRRIELYAQQYWWRLLRVLQDAFPQLVRILGYEEFNNKIATPYLEDCPPHSWALNLLGDTLPKWIGSKWRDEELLYLSALVDYAFVEGFVIKELPSIKDGGLPLDQIAVKPLVIQPTTHLFALPFDLFSFRKELLKEEPPYWQDNPLPELLREPLYFVLWRNADRDMAWKAISKEEWHLLNHFQTPKTLEEALAWLENTPTLNKVEESLTEWFSRWTANNWITLGQ